MNFLQLLLFPFSILYDLITRLRNFQYDKGQKHSIKFEIPVISVGNLTVGGTGKTPHIEYLIRLLADSYKVATLSRGYGRKTRGFIIANEEATALSIGDEPMQFYQKFQDKIMVTVGEERVLAIPSILLEQPETEVILLDDAFQHRPVHPSLNILLCNYNRPFFKDFVMPSGRLRESRNGAERADIVIVSKCPSELKEEEKTLFESKIKKYTQPNTPIFFSTIEYQTPIHIFDLGQKIEKEILLVTSIANPRKVKEDLSKNYNIAKHLIFPDHHKYQEDNIELIKTRFQEISGNNKSILTTEKDIVKLIRFSKQFEGLSIFYIPIQIRLLNQKESLDSLVMDHLNSFEC